MPFTILATLYLQYSPSNTCSTPIIETTCNTLYFLSFLTINDQEEMDVNIKVAFSVTLIGFVGWARFLYNPARVCMSIRSFYPSAQTRFRTDFHESSYFYVMPILIQEIKSGIWNLSFWKMGWKWCSIDKAEWLNTLIGVFNLRAK